MEKSTVTRNKAQRTKSGKKRRRKKKLQQIDMTQEKKEQPAASVVTNITVDRNARQGSGTV